MRIELATATMRLSYDCSIPALIRNGEELAPSVRRLGELEDVVLDMDFFSRAAKDVILYYMFRDLHRREDEDLLRGNGIRYDVTIIPPRNLGTEYVKTAGHYHPEAEASMSYTEIYEVLHGKAHYLLQKAERDRITDVLLVEAVKGDKVIIPPNYGHVTINPSDETLIMTNLVSSRFESVYEPYRKRKGAAYYELKDGSFRKNENFARLPHLTQIKAEKRKWLPQEMDLYTIFVRTPGLFEFLNDPSEYSGLPT
jgi:glucose-6-phosphate isomerase